MRHSPGTFESCSSKFAVLLLDARNRGRSDSDEFSSLPRFAKTWSMDSTGCGASPGLTLIA
jgi:hypothetical protein